MASNKKSRYGVTHGDFNPLLLRADLLRIGRGEASLDPDLGFPVLRCILLVRLAYDQNVAALPDGTKLDFHDRIHAALDNAALVEVSFAAECRLLARLHSDREISDEVFASRMGDAHHHHGLKAQEAANAAAGWLAQIDLAVTPRRRGRPAKKLLPDESDLVDFHVIQWAASLISREPVDVPPKRQHYQAIPEAVRWAADRGLLKPNTCREKGKELVAHIDRLRRTFIRLYGSPE